MGTHLTNEQLAQALMEAIEAHRGELDERTLALGITSYEFWQATGRQHTREYWQQRLRVLVEDGAVECKLAPRSNIAGFTRDVPVYRVKAK